MPDLPRIPDQAFYEAIGRHFDFFHVGSRQIAEAPEAEAEERVHEVVDNFARALGLDREDDSRAYSLCRTLMGHTRSVEPEAIDNVEVHAAVFGLMLGLLLAQETGWEVPATKVDPPHPLD